MTQEELQKAIENGETEITQLDQAASQEIGKIDELSRFIAVLEVLRKPKYHLTSAPTFTPKTWLEQIQYVDDGATQSIYVWINNAWVQLGGGDLPTYTAPDDTGVEINSGASTGGAGTDFVINAGAGNSGAGGDVDINAGAGDGAIGGTIDILGGAGTSGGGVSVNGGNASSGTPGAVVIKAGFATGNNSGGGTLTLQAGNGHGSGNGGSVYIKAGTSSTGEKGYIVLETLNVPTSASDNGTTGAIAWDSDYIYICTSTNTWKRAALSTW
ncbi:MAG: hypothetical protein VKN72_03905 [Nostocales cyanobacterium 94392]|nr:hypothetical protein [Nostocales cyanobacterium 94392]